MISLRTNALIALTASVLFALAGCVDFSLNRRHAVAFVAETIQSKDTVSSMQRLKEAVSATLQELGYKQIAHNPNAWRKDSLRVDIVQDDHNGLIVESYAFGGGKQMEKAAALDIELVSKLRLISGVSITTDYGVGNTTGGAE